MNHNNQYRYCRNCGCLEVTHPVPANGYGSFRGCAIFVANEPQCFYKGELQEREGVDITHTFTPHQETWEQEFRANFLSDDGVSEIEFIRNLISKEREKAAIGQIEIYARREADAIKVGAEAERKNSIQNRIEGEELARVAERNRIIEVAEGIFSKLDKDTQYNSWHQGWNAAITDLIERIKNP